MAARTRTRAKSMDCGSSRIEEDPMLSETSDSRPVIILLLSLPPEILVLVLRSLSTHDLGRLGLVCRLFHRAPHSVVEEVLRLRAQEAGLASPQSLLPGETWLQLLLSIEIITRKHRRARFAAAQHHDAGFYISEGQLLSCGSMLEVDRMDDDGEWYETTTYAHLGHGHRTSAISIPSVVPEVRHVRFSSVSTNQESVFAVAEDGSAWSWGENGCSTLGHSEGSGTDRSGTVWPGSDCCDRPMRIEALHQVRVVEMAAGLNHVAALAKDGSVWCWGSQPLCGSGAQPTSTDEQSPQRVSALDGKWMTAISAGEDSTYALDIDGSAWSWGHASACGLGHGSLANEPLPRAIDALRGTRVVAVAAGLEHVAALSIQGTLWAWGKISFFLKSLSPLPAVVNELRETCVVAIACGEDVIAALAKDGTVWTWGRGEGGELGHGDGKPYNSPKAIESLRGRPMAAITMSPYATALFMSTHDGQLFTTGDCRNYQHSYNRTLLLEPQRQVHARVRLA